MIDRAAPPTRRLAQALATLDGVVVAFSGGVDSSVLAHSALATLGPQRVLAVTADSASLASGELDHCRDLAAAWGLPWRSVRTDELADPRYLANGRDRCARCKHALMDQLGPIASARDATVVLGVNLDDLDDHRPGQQAAAARGARFPLVDAGLTKQDVRSVARGAGLSVWDRPAMPCLSSRLPYGTTVTVDLLARVDRAEAAVRALGFDDVRVRHHGDTARVEVPRHDLPSAAAVADRIERALSALGYRYVTLDLAGLRSGNLNGVADLVTTTSDDGAVMSDPVAAAGRTADLGHSRLDLGRGDRIGMPEAVFAAGKTPAQCVEIVDRLLAEGDDPVIVTRCADEHLRALDHLGPAATWSGTLTWRHAPSRTGEVVVVSGGTSDEPVVHECLGTLTAMGMPTRAVRDVGVAGLHRLLDSLDDLRDVSAVVAVAGIEAALPTVLAGLVPSPIIAVPTSVGYGTTFDGLTTLLSMMSSCAPGITVVGIDNGYGAACAALRIVGPPT